MENIKKISFRVLGCRLNQSEVNSLQNEFQNSGYQVVSKDERSDIIIVNSCAVTNQAEAKTRAEINAAAKISPNGKVMLTGCYAQGKKAELLNLKNVYCILGNLEKTRLLKFVDNLEEWENKVEVADINDNQLLQSHDYYTFFRDSVATTERTRAFVKIQDGCNYFCSYCIIPYLRGRVRSRKPEEIIREIRTLESKNFKEIVLSGINIGTYHYENQNLSWLLLELLKNTKTVRFRLSSIEPNLIDDEMIRIIKENKQLCNYFHIPMQHSSNIILKSMNRKYTCLNFQKVLEKIRHKIPDICIGSDVIVGFPGETNTEFEEMYRFIQKNKFAYLHIFRYSKREGTKACKMKNQVSSIDKKIRSEKLHKLDNILRKEYYKHFLGCQLEVLFEQKNADNTWSGISSNYIYVKVRSGKDLNNKIERVKICRVLNSYVEGSLIEKS